MSADLIGDDACREAFNKARQQRFYVHGLDVVCEPDIFRAGYAAGRDSEIAKRDARIVELDKKYGWALSEFAAIKAQEPVAWPEGGSDAVEGAALGAFDSLGQPEHDLESWCAGYAEAVYAHAAPVSEAKAQGVVMPERKTKADYGVYIDEFADEAAAIYNAALDEVARLNAAPVQKVSVSDDLAFAMRQRDQYAARVYALELGLLRIADDYHPGTDADAQLALGEIREAIRGLALAATPSAPDGHSEAWPRSGDRCLCPACCHSRKSPAAPAADAGLVEALEASNMLLRTKRHACENEQVCHVLDVHIKRNTEALAAHRAQGLA